MIKSMTAYGRHSFELEGSYYRIEVISLNRKNLDLALVLPREWALFELEIRKWTLDYAKRGSITIKIQKEAEFEEQAFFQIDFDLLKKIKQNLEEIQQKLNIRDPVSFEFLLDQLAKLKMKESKIDDQQLKKVIREAFEKTLKDWDEMRICEGAALFLDIEKRLDQIALLIDKIEELASKTVQNYEQKLKKKLMESGFFQDVDFERICKEVLIYSDKIDITEEVIRLKSHIKQFLSESVQSELAVGKKLDFLMQEMHREANSLGVKCQDLEVIQLTVNIKSELEKIREQVQNIE